MGSFRGLLSSLFLGLAFAPFADATAADYMCYIPGANGLTAYVKEKVSKGMLIRGVPFVALDPGVAGSVEVRGARVLTQIEYLIKRDPLARCHIFGYSMGGVVSRWIVNHGSVQTPQGMRPLRERVLSQTSAASPHLGTPLAKILRRYWNSAAPGVEDLSEENMAKFNDPASPTYSPVVEGIPAYSYRSFITDKSDADQPLVLIGFQLIWQDRTRRHLDPLNDGIVPTDSQPFGEVLGDLNVSHGYFHHETNFSVRLEDFLRAHWNFLTKGTKPLLF